MTNIYWQIIAEDRELISYRPKLNKITGSVIATILLQQILYWYNKHGRFYKFKEPCNHPDYKPGDSWTEELVITKYEFDSALKILKKLLIIDTQISIDRKTYYTVNTDELDKLILSIYVNRNSQHGKLEKPIYVERKNQSSIIYRNNTEITQKEKEEIFSSDLEEEKSTKEDQEFCNQNNPTLSVQDSITTIQQPQQLFETNQDIFLDDVQNTAQVKTTQQKQSNKKQSATANYKQEITDQILPTFNKATGKTFKSIKGFEKNYIYWREDFTLQEILEAIANIFYHPFWSDKMTPEIFFRTKDRQGQNVNYIQDMLNVEREDDDIDWEESIIEVKIPSAEEVRKNLEIFKRSCLEMQALPEHAAKMQAVQI